MPSELWQRLREMRKFADKTQADMAKIANVTRSGYAFWENADPTQRTLPNVDQIRAVAQACGVPVSWLLDDNSEVSDLWRGTAIKVAEAPAPAYTQAPPPSDRAQQRFWAAVEYIVTSKDPARENAWTRAARAGAVEMTLDYQYNDSAAVFSRSANEEDLTRTIGYLLTAARVIKSMNLMILVNSAEPPSPGLVESAKRFLGIQIHHTPTPELAAQALLASK